MALFALCLGNCSGRAKNITWQIYKGSLNATQNITRWTSLNQSNLSLFSKWVHWTNWMFVYRSLQVRRRRTSPPRTTCFSPILRFFSGNSKWFIRSPPKLVRVHWTSWSINRLEMAPVRSHRRMAQPWPCSLFLVPIGSTKMESKIILSSFGQPIFRHARWSLFLRHWPSTFVFRLVKFLFNCWFLFVINEIVSPNGRISLPSQFKWIRIFSVICWTMCSVLEDQRRMPSFDCWVREIRIKWVKWSVHFLNTSISWTKKTFNRPLPVDSSLFLVARDAMFVSRWSSGVEHFCLLFGIIGSSFFFAVESLGFGGIWERIERSSHSARVSQWISRQSANQHAANDSNSIEFVAATHSIDKSIDAFCSGQSLFSSSSLKRNNERNSVWIDDRLEWMFSLGFGVEFSRSRHFSRRSANLRHFASSMCHEHRHGQISSRERRERTLGHLGSEWTSARTKESVASGFSRCSTIPCGVSNRFGMGMDPSEYEELFFVDDRKEKRHV